MKWKNIDSEKPPKKAYLLATDGDRVLDDIWFEDYFCEDDLVRKQVYVSHPLGYDYDSCEIDAHEYPHWILRQDIDKPPKQ